MKRAEREVTDIKEIERMLNEAKVCRIGLMDGDYPYIIPMYFGYTLDGDQLVLYFHSTPQGKKIDLIKQNNCAAFEIDMMGDICPGDMAIDFSSSYECITGKGTIDILNGIEKLTGLNSIMSKYNNSSKEHKYSEQMLNNVVILKLTAEQFCCRSQHTEN